MEFSGIPHLQGLEELYVNMAGEAAMDPYTGLYNTLAAIFNPPTSAGFENRLYVTMGISAYLMFACALHAMLYGVAMRRQGKKLWLFKRVPTHRGKYIITNVYLASIIPSFILGGLMIGLIERNRQVYVDHDDQKRVFLWRNLIWILAWLQGWILGYANVTTVLLTSTSSTSFVETSRFSQPSFVNGIFIGVPCIVIIGLMVPGVYCSKCYDDAYAAGVSALKLLKNAAAEFDKGGGAIDPAVGNEVGALLFTALNKYNNFSDAFLALLIFWTCASFVLVGVSLAGILLCQRLRKLMKENSETSAMEKHYLDQFGKCDEVQDSEKAERQTSLESGSTNSPISSEKGSTSVVTGVPPRKKSLTRPSFVDESDDCVGNVRGRMAMQKLLRDLIVIVAAVSIESCIFSADTILLAVKHTSIYKNWTQAEVGITLIVWAYSVGVSLGTTLCVVNQAWWLIKAPTKAAPFQPAFVDEDSFRQSRHSEELGVRTAGHHDLARRGGGRGGSGAHRQQPINYYLASIQVTTYKEVHVDSVRENPDSEGVVAEPSNGSSAELGTNSASSAVPKDNKINTASRPTLLKRPSSLLPPVKASAYIPTLD